MEEDDQDKIKLQIVYQNITKTTPIFPKKFSNLILLFYNLFNIKKDDKSFYYTYSVKLERKLEDKNDELFINQISKIKAQENPTIYVWDSNKDYDKLMNEESYLESKYYLDLNKSNETTSSVYLNNNYNEMKENLEKVENELKNTGDMINSEINNIIELQEEIEFFEEAKDNKNNKRKIKKIKCKKKIRIKKSNSFTNEDFNKFNKPKGFIIFGDSLEEINIKSRNNKNSNSLDKIDKRKSVSNILYPSNIIYNKKKKKHMKKYINKGKIEENDEELEQSNDNIKKNKNKNKNKIINNKKQFNQGKKNLNKDEESKNSYKDSDYISESDNGTNSQKNRINKLKNNMKAKKKNEESKNERNNKNNKIKNFKMNSNLIAINKFSLMYFCDLIEHYMKKKSFALCARQIANYQKYLEMKFSIKILFRVVLKRIIFYKLKFMHRYKRINKFLIKNRIKNIKYLNKKKK